MLCLKAHAKINWTLDILGRRADGYHLMDMLMQTVGLSDTLWLEEADTLTLEDGEASPHERSRLDDRLSSLPVVYDESNLVYQAALRLQERCKRPLGARMRLKKRIPSGAGMGGGSADAAAALAGLNELWRLGLTRDELLSIGLSLGADVPFMLTGGLARVGGIGEAITPLSPSPEAWLVLIKPCGGLSTREIFNAFDALNPDALVRPRTSLAQEALLSGDLRALGRAMGNVLEEVSAQSRPALKEAMSCLTSHGALRAMMTGSGSVVYGVFDAAQKAESAFSALSQDATARGWEGVWLTQTQKTDCIQHANGL